MKPTKLIFASLIPASFSANKDFVSDIVKINENVEAEQIVAETFMPGDVIPINISILCFVYFPNSYYKNKYCFC